MHTQHPLPAPQKSLHNEPLKVNSQDKSVNITKTDNLL